MAGLTEDNGIRQASSGQFVQVPGAAVAWRSRGNGAEIKTLYERDQDCVYVTDFMTPEEQADVFACTLLFDHQPAIQAAIDYALYADSTVTASGGPRVRAPGGVMRIDRPIQAGYGVDFRSLLFEGEGRRYGGGNAASGSGTAFVVNFNDAPAVVVQGGRFVKLKGFSLYGQNTAYIVGILTSPAMTDLDVATWVDPAFPASASSRYAPYAGVAIDPYSGAQPGVAYPAVAYPAFLGSVAQYGKDTSSATTIEDLYVEGFVVGVVQQPSDADGNGDFTALRNVSIAFCAYGLAWGNTQSRVPSLDRCDMNVVHTGFATAVFGRRQGEPQFECRSVSFNAMIRLLNVPTLDFGQGPSFVHCFAEGIYSLGVVGENAQSAGSVLFDDCTFGFGWWSVYGIPIYTLDNQSLALVTFRNVKFYLAGFAGSLNVNDCWGSLSFNSFSFGGAVLSGRGYAFEGCSVDYAAEPTQLWQKCAFNATNSYNFRDLQSQLARFEGQHAINRYDLDSGASQGPALYGESNFGARNLCLPVYGKLAISDLSGDDPGVSNLRCSYGFSAVGAVTQSGRNIQFTNGGISADFLAAAGGDVGDVLQELTTRAIFWVYARTGTTISARAMTGFGRDGNLLTPLPDSADFASMVCRRYLPAAGGAVLMGDITAGSPDITNIIETNIGGAVNLAGMVAVGDWFWVYLRYDLQIQDPFGGNRVTVVDNAAKKITCAANFTATKTRVRLGLFVRPAVANGTPT